MIEERWRFEILYQYHFCAFITAVAILVLHNLGITYWMERGDVYKEFTSDCIDLSTKLSQWPMVYKMQLQERTKMCIYTYNIWACKMGVLKATNAAVPI